MGARTRAKAGHPKSIPLKVEALRSFQREARKILSEKAYRELLSAAAQFRELAPVIIGTSGLRKMRWPLENNKGKRSGARVLYYYGGDHMPIYLIAFYAKASKKDISPAEKKAIKKLIEAVNAEYEPERNIPRLKIIK
jgi:hypothetical protein